MESKLAPKTTLIARTDSTSAKAIAGRLGLSKQTKHIQLRYLYMQDLTQNGLLRMEKVHTSENPADTLAKYLPGHVLNYHLEQLGIRTITTDLDADTKTVIAQVLRYYATRSEKTWR